jgi:DNA-binding FadR family transcriptional regulator
MAIIGSEPMLREGHGALSGSRVTRAEALARTLESEIVGAALAPGERIGTKGDLRQRFGVAVATINEAVRLMEMRGLVVARPGPGGGVFVTSASARTSASQLILGFNWGQATLADCVEVRLALEPLICRHAAREHRSTDIHALNRILDGMDESIHNREAYFHANWRFHRKLATLCRNMPLQSMYLLLCDFLESGLSDFEFDVIEPERVDVHRRLLDAIEAGDEAAIDAALHEHQEQSPLTAGHRR